MTYCTQCGYELEANQPKCFNCGKVVKTNKKTEPVKIDMMYALIGFFLPIIGIILYFINKESNVVVAKSSLRGVLFAVIVIPLFGLIGLIILSFILSIINSQTLMFFILIL